MRIIAGTLRGRRLPSPAWSGLRPTSDRLRETLFAILGDTVDGAAVLDGCAGTGALGIEALSRGAAGVTFIDRDARAVALIEANLERCRIVDRGVVIRGALPQAIETIGGGPFDLALLDPPYDYDDGAIGGILSAVGRRTAAGGRVVLERPRRAAQVAAAPLRHVRRVRAGDSVLDFHVRVQE